MTKRIRTPAVKEMRYKVTLQTVWSIEAATEQLARWVAQDLCKDRGGGRYGAQAGIGSYTAAKVETVITEWEPIR